ncbi:hypothetical protein [Brucella intermedia]|uniref:hypothetical protein n=1 Tax=Brucella intermedia TaxID=94625 RepID=UPI002362A3C5|nr:hypothetical protein [Brucella intermedia]
MADNLEIKAKLDSAQAKALMQKLSGPRMYQALSVAVNDSARQVERKAESIVAKTLSIPLKRARLGIWIRPFSTPQTLTAVIKGSGSVIPLKAFKAKEDGDGVTAKIWGQTLHHPGAFIYGGPLGDHNRALGMGGHVFHRPGKTWVQGKRGKIEKAKGAAIAEAMAQDAVSRANESYAVERLEANVLRQLDRYSRNRGGKS